MCINNIGEVLKAKWKNLRDSYQKYLRANSTTTGQAVNVSKGKHLDPYKNWSWAKQLEFLKPHLSFADTMSNVSLNKDVVDSASQIHDDNNVSNDLEVFNVQPQKLQKKNKIINEPAQVSNIDKVLEHLSKKQKTTSSALDAVDMLMMSHAKTIKTFSAKRQALAKKKISELVSDLEMEEIEEKEYQQSINNSLTQLQTTEQPTFTDENYDAMNLTMGEIDILNL